MNRWEVWVGALLGLVGVAILASRWLLPHWRTAREKARLICTCGYVPDPPTDAADRVMRFAARCAVWIQIGKVEASGLENLDCGAPKLITPTHGHYLDPFVLAHLVPDRARCMAARGLLRFGGGIGALLFSRWGVFCTDLRPGKGAPALHAAMRVLLSGQTLVVFPEGWAHMDGAVGPFKGGAVSVARMAARKGGRPVSIVPVHLRYGAYPGPWIKKLPPPLQYLTVLLGFIFFRRGVHVVAGKPLLTSELPKRTAEATEELRNAILALKPPLAGTPSQGGEVLRS